MLQDLPRLNNSETRRKIRESAQWTEPEALDLLVPLARLSPAEEASVWEQAHGFVEQIREKQRGQGGIDALLQEFSLSSDEGIALMCLAEALLRIPDDDTQDSMINDRLSGGDWSSHLGHSDSVFVNASAWGLLLTGKVTRLSTSRAANLLGKTVSRLGEPVIRTAMRYAMQIMGSEFVMGETIAKALDRARDLERKGYTYSYDMLGEGARTMADADHYLEKYREAIAAIGQAAGSRENSPGISIKLSALHPRYELRHHDRALAELTPRLLSLTKLAKEYNLPLTVDAEESWRLDLSLEIIERVFSDPELAGYKGFGLAVQAYQKQGYAVVEWAIDLARSVGRRLCVRLVKGAYWDTEIKWAQERGYPVYPVFSEKCATDVSYQACAALLMANRHVVYPQFATHNAYTLATILAFEKSSGVKGSYEFQRLHGMGDELYDELVAAGMACRIYAPVGEHEDLLAYLVRRLLENGANTSFVNNIQNRRIPVSKLLEDPVRRAGKIRFTIPLPTDIYVPHRTNSLGTNLDDVLVLEQLSAVQLTQAEHAVGSQVPVMNPADPDDLVGHLVFDDPASMTGKLEQVVKGQADWSSIPANVRAGCLLRFADCLEASQADYIALCIREAGKSLEDSIAEIREAVDFCRYYAKEALALDAAPLGTILCISPWNFPLAIFTGQVTAALVAGNTVLAKPAEQTSLIACRAVEDLHQCGVPGSALQAVISTGPPVSDHLVTDDRVAAVMFTGSNRTARSLATTLLNRGTVPVPLIAETGGMNAMIVDSTALTEQVVDDVIVSAFGSAGQRCSALRILYVQDVVADEVIGKIIGKMAELRVGNPDSYITDLGPVIDGPALRRLEDHLVYLEEKRARILHRCEIPGSGNFFAPTLIEVDTTEILVEEVFGPVLHVRRFRSRDLEQIVEEINSTGFGLTMGIHSRIESRFDRIAELVRSGNIYVNRNMVGAIVGVQPFGGRGKSGTGPKAGGPHYLPALTRHRQPVLETGNAALPASGQLPRPEAARWRDWCQTPVPDRIRRARLLLLAILADNHDLDADGLLTRFQLLCEWFESQPEEQGRPATRLVSPTGETDTLVLEPHGMVNVVARGQSRDEILMMLTALIAGNCVSVCDSGWGVPTTSDFDGLLQYNDCLDLSVDALAIWNDESACRELYRRHLAEQQSLPRIIVGTLDPVAYHWEKTISINTTAAGGNASLMTGVRQ